MTKQNYAELQVLQDKYGETGLTILAFPCNDFKHQEPGTNEDIMRFAKKKGASFPIFGKLDCENGDITHPLYQFLKKSISKESSPIKLKWNFHKFLCDGDGVPIKDFGPRTSPLAIENDILQLLH